MVGEEVAEELRRIRAELPPVDFDEIETRLKEGAA